MNSTQQAIILVSIIGTILSEYDDGEASASVATLKHDCKRFMTVQSGTKSLPFIGVRVVDLKKHENFLKSVRIGDEIWRKSIDRYAKQSVVIEATHLIRAVYDFNPSALEKHAHISKRKIDALSRGAVDGNDEHKRNGAVIGGHLTELLSERMGTKINGRLRALRSKVENDLKYKGATSGKS